MDPTRSKLTYALIPIVGLLTVSPVVMLLLGSFSQVLTAFGSFTLAKYVEAYTDPALADVMVNTVLFVVGSSTLATGLALFLAYLIIAPALASFDVSLEESSRVFGASTWRTLVRITLPVLRPAILAAFILGVVRSLASFAVPSVIGMPGRVEVLATYLYQMIATGFTTDYGKAAALGMSVLAASITLIVVYRALTAEGEKYVTVSSRGYRPTVIELGRARTPLFVVVALLSLVMIVLPVAVLLYTSFIPYSMLPSARAFSMMSLRNWVGVLDDPLSILALRNSLFLGVVGATIGVLLSIFVAYAIVKGRTRAAGVLESLSFLSFSFPGIVIGVGFMWFFVQTPLYATLTALLIGYIATYLSALRRSTAGERVRADPCAPRGIIAGVRRQPHHDHAPHHRAIADSRHRFGMDPVGVDVPARTDAVGGAVTAGHRGAGGADPALCR
ncbi:MAG: ABC transporter permease subunit [Burkholderiales bacterium]|nr:ABC transporter permease subunit [Burkholderiales bacterium]